MGIWGWFVLSITGVYAQNNSSEKKDASNYRDSIPSFTLQECIDYALEHQPAVQQSLIKERIAKLTTSISLAAWLPQVNTANNLTHYFRLPTNSVTSSSGSGSTFEKTGVVNTSTLGINVTQAIFTPVYYMLFRPNTYTKIKLVKSPTVPRLNWFHP